MNLRSQKKTSTLHFQEVEYNFNIPFKSENPPPKKKKSPLVKNNYSLTTII